MYRRFNNQFFIVCCLAFPSGQGLLLLYYLSVLMGIMLSKQTVMPFPCGWQNASQSVASNQPSKVSSPSCDHLVTALVLIAGFLSDGFKTR